MITEIILLLVKYNIGLYLLKYGVPKELNISLRQSKPHFYFQKAELGVPV